MVRREETHLRKFEHDVCQGFDLLQMEVVDLHEWVEAVEGLELAADASSWLVPTHRTFQ